MMEFLARINSEGIITDKIIASSDFVPLEGTWVVCQDWDSIGSKISENKPDYLIAVELRAVRDKLLIELDEVVLNPLRFASFTDEQKAELATYRQALLDVPQQAGFPSEVTWPERPTFI